MSTETKTEKYENHQDPKCNDPCGECQRVVYQIKFQGSADCEVNGVCRNTCYKVREAWGTAFRPYEPFVKDMFGKCEICFRNGHCTISQCKEQERNELEVISRVINTSRLTAKISPDMLVEFPSPADPDAVPKVIKMNNKVEKELKKDIHDAVKIKSAENVIPKVQNLMKSYFDKPEEAVKGNAFKVLNGEPAPVSAASVTYWNDQTAKGNNQIDKAQKVVQKISKAVDEIEKLKQGATKKQTRAVAKVAKKEKRELAKLTRKVNKLNKKLDKKEKVIKKLIKSPKIKDASAKDALKNSLNQVKQVRNVINQAQKELKQDRRKL